MNVLHLVLSPRPRPRVLRIKFRFLSKHFTNWAIPLACPPFSYFRGSSIPLSGWVGYADWLVSSWDLLVSASPSWVSKHIYHRSLFQMWTLRAKFVSSCFQAHYWLSCPHPQFWLWYYSLVFAIWIKTHTWMNTIYLSCESRWRQSSENLPGEWHYSGHVCLHTCLLK